MTGLRLPPPCRGLRDRFSGVSGRTGSLVHALKALGARTKTATVVLAFGRCPTSAVPNHQGNVNSPTRSRRRPTSSLFTRGHRDDQCGISSCLGIVWPEPPIRRQGIAGGPGTCEGFAGAPGSSQSLAGSSSSEQDCSGSSGSEQDYAGAPGSGENHAGSSGSGQDLAGSSGSEQGLAGAPGSGQGLARAPGPEQGFRAILITLAKWRTEFVGSVSRVPDTLASH
jgi:hypothetical protein